MAVRWFALTIIVVCLAFYTNVQVLFQKPQSFYILTGLNKLPQVDLQVRLNLHPASRPTIPLWRYSQEITSPVCSLLVKPISCGSFHSTPVARPLLDQPYKPQLYQNRQRIVQNIVMLANFAMFDNERQGPAN
ncbi:hypothetical protein CRM22_004978 [Opisthorchis felineus]|uniref:Uncharacterized protein n=1 Tax=Opisthorchis felineus TaxID=147828 RepID=A0A4S2M0B5_OPIFE|nr:hypothetical protein CRM22_004978 [Opisthorchis felineus]